MPVAPRVEKELVIFPTCPCYASAFQGVGSKATCARRYPVRNARSSEPSTFRYAGIGKGLTRIVYFHKDHLEHYKWLKRFRKSEKLLPGYKELVYKAVPTPLDIVIVDDSKALLSFPILDMSQFFDAVVVTEERVVKSFCQVFSLLVLNSKTIVEAQNCKRLGVPEYLKLHNTNLRKIERGA